MGWQYFCASFTVVGGLFIFRKLQLIASDIHLLSLHFSLKLVAFILSAIVVSLGDFGICLALFIIHPLWMPSVQL